MFLLIFLGIVIYCWFFFATPFEPYQGLSGVTWTRFSFFSYFLLPDEYFAAWVGSDGKISLTDRIPVIFTASLCFMAASGYGWFILSLPLFKFWRKTISSLEHWLLSTIVGLSFCSLVLFCFGLCENLNNTAVIRTLTILGVLLFLFLNSLFSYQDAYESQSAYPLPKLKKWSWFKKSVFF
ncbi:MAG: hypothetical protein LBI18_04930, partial [Planctomycetaceae bacterium]|nr:hypothetical protein [Planctomycetaceae bacterium]